MPELPEVEAARRAVEEHCRGGLVRRAVVADDAKVVEGMTAPEMQRALGGKKIVAAHRKGKQLWVEFDQPPSLCFQFGMTGAVQIKGVKVTKYVRSAVKDDDEWPSKFSKVLLELDNGVEISFTDKRRFARIRLLDNPATSAPVSELGPDAFTELPEEAAFCEAVLKKKVAIKAVLIDQSFLAGIGNWIADEVLYQSRIHPEQPAWTLTADDCKRLRGAIKEVLETAIGAEAEPSEYPEGWIFHHREKKKTSVKSLDGKKIDFITVGGRTSAYVPELQKRRVKSDKEVDEPDEKPRRGRSAANKPTSKAEQEDASDEQEVKKESKKRGAQSKKASEANKAELEEEEDPSEEQEVKKEPKKRGVQSKKASAAEKAEQEEASDEEGERKKRGAQSKKPSAAKKAEQEVEEDPCDEQEVKKETKKRGAQPAAKKQAKQEDEEDPADEQEVKKEAKKRGAQAKKAVPAKKPTLKATQEKEEDPSDEQDVKKEPKKRGAQAKKAVPAKKPMLKAEQEEEEDPSDEQAVKTEPKKGGAQSKKATEKDEEDPSKGPKKRGAQSRKGPVIKKPKLKAEEEEDSEPEKQDSTDEEEPKKKAAKPKKAAKQSKC